MLDRLKRAVLGFTAQLAREGYKAALKDVGNMYLIQARERRSGVVLWYLAALEKDGIHIDELLERKA